MTNSDPTRAILLGIIYPPSVDHWPSQDSLQELAELSRTADIVIVQKYLQKRTKPHPKSYLGSGKLQELIPFIKEHCITLVITDDELTPSQTKEMESVLETKVIDRTGLILDIFAQRAKTYEAKLQVELAQLEYLLPRLTRLWTHLSRLGGGIGTRGPGEKQLEVDKRQLRKRVSLVRKRLKKIRQHRKINREKRKTVPVLTGAIVGYTNAGKSTLLNLLTKSHVLAEDKLFATLDPTTKPIRLPNKEKLLLTDTVGFIQKLPHQLVSSFRATLEEVMNTHIILHVIDATHHRLLDTINVSNTILKDLGATDMPILYIFNKWDKVKDPLELKKQLRSFQPQVRISALKKNRYHHPTRIIRRHHLKVPTGIYLSYPL